MEEHSPWLAACRSYTVQSRVLVGSTTRTEAGLPKSTVNQENPPQTCPQASLLRSSSLIEIPSPRIHLGFIVKLAKLISMGFTRKHDGLSRPWDDQFSMTH